MPVLKPRSRLVYFRVSEDEFMQISAMCRTAGARSLSAFARAAMQRMLAAYREEPLADKLKTFDELTSRLIEKLRRIDELLETNGRNGHDDAKAAKVRGGSPLENTSA